METASESSKFLVPTAIVIAGALIAGAIYMGDQKSTVVGSNTEQVDVEIAPLSEKDHILGSRSAEVIIYEYSDTECPFCKVFHNTMKDLVAEYDGKVAWVYRHFPIASLHKKAIKEAEATECAYELGGNQSFWNYLDQVFELTKSNDSLDPAELPKIATTIGLDALAFNQCLSSGRHNAFVLKSVEAAVAAGARGTPYSVAVTRIGKKVVINGAEPIDRIKTKIDALLK